VAMLRIKNAVLGGLILSGALSVVLSMSAGLSWATVEPALPLPSVPPVATPLKCGGFLSQSIFLPGKKQLKHFIAQQRAFDADGEIEVFRTKKRAKRAIILVGAGASVTVETAKVIDLHIRQQLVSSLQATSRFFPVYSAAFYTATAALLVASNVPTPYQSNIQATLNDVGAQHLYMLGCPLTFLMDSLRYCIHRRAGMEVPDAARYSSTLTTVESIPEYLLDLRGGGSIAVIVTTSSRFLAIRDALMNSKSFRRISP
jgi:hypothetical protein